MSMHRAVTCCVVLVCLMVLLVENTQAHITFFSPKELMVMKFSFSGKKPITFGSPVCHKGQLIDFELVSEDREEEREGKKEIGPRSEDIQFEEVPVQQVPQMKRGINPEQTMETAVHLSPKQLDRVTPVLEEIIHELTRERQKAK